MLLWLAIILAVAWIAGFGVFHVAGAAIHILVVLAIISLIVHLLRGRRGV
ncbi:MAG TPA: lmo0937 family membrane protein [Polyangia bacterium]|nr:lmo0937 family membrane protein [Polyangia bacterium]